jgi:chromosome partitioning protein
LVNTIGLGIEPESYKSSLNDVLLQKKSIKDVLLETKVKNLYIAPSHIRLDRAEQQLAPELFRETFLHKAIKTLNYDL